MRHLANQHFIHWLNLKEKFLYLLSSLTSSFLNSIGKKQASVQRILVVKLDEIGDMVTALHVFYHLNEQFPEAKIEVLCKPFNAIFFRYMKNVSVTKEAKGKYELIVELRGNYHSIFYALMHPPCLRLDRGTVRMRNKFSGGQLNELVTNFQIIKPVLKSDTAMLKNSIIYSDAEVAKVDSWLNQEKIDTFVLLHIGARDEFRRWPVDKFQTIIKFLNSKGLRCLLVGGVDDYYMNESCLIGLSPINRNIAGIFNLLEFAALCSKARLFVGNESGPLHIASAQDTPLVALFGPGVKDVFYPIGNRVKIHHYFLDKGHKTQNIYNSTIYRISEEEVIASINELLDEAR